MKLIFVRHGETIENKKGVFQGIIPGTLSSNGIKQAKKLALRLKNYNLDYIFSSDLSRALDTAKEIQKYHKNIGIIQDKLLREADLGDWTGKKISEVDKNNPPKNKEKHNDVQKRILTFLNKLNNHFDSDKTILIVSHFGCNVALLSYFMKKPIENMLEIKQGNTALNEIDIYDLDNYDLKLINSTSHLDIN